MVSVQKKVESLIRRVKQKDFKELGACLVEVDTYNLMENLTHIRHYTKLCDHICSYLKRQVFVMYLYSIDVETDVERDEVACLVSHT